MCVPVHRGAISLAHPRRGTRVLRRSTQASLPHLGVELFRTLLDLLGGDRNTSTFGVNSRPHVSRSSLEAICLATTELYPKEEMTRPCSLRVMRRLFQPRGPVPSQGFLCDSLSVSPLRGPCHLSGPHAVCTSLVHGLFPGGLGARRRKVPPACLEAKSAARRVRRP